MDNCQSTEETNSSSCKSSQLGLAQLCSVLSPSFNGNKISQKTVKLKKLYDPEEADTYPDKLAFVLKNVFTKQECRDLIALSEKYGYVPALLNVGGGREVLTTKIRKSYRTIIDDEEFTKILWSRIKAFIPGTFYGNKVVGINERLRFLRYDPGDKFTMHQDGSYLRPDGSERSMITLQIYLNEGFKGGETTFIGDKKKRNIPIVPKEGMILVFQQNITHEGSELKAGRKYTIRTEVMYQIGNKLTPELKEKTSTTKTKMNE